MSRPAEVALDYYGRQMTTVHRLTPTEAVVDWLMAIPLPHGAVRRGRGEIAREIEGLAAAAEKSRHYALCALVTQACEGKDYVPGKWCVLEHTGNQRIYWDGRYGQCAGCGRSYSAHELLPAEEP